MACACCPIVFVLHKPTVVSLSMEFLILVKHCSNLSTHNRCLMIAGTVGSSRDPVLGTE